MFLITGSLGQLGSELSRVYSKKEAYFTDHTSLDISDINTIRKFMDQNPVKGIINCAAYTNVDKAETERDICFKVNVDGVANLSKIANEFSIPLLHISTDYVFSGSSSIPYKENDSVDPKSIYAQSKEQGEKEFFKYAKYGIILRSSWIYSEFRSNFLKTIIKLGKEKDSLDIVYDQISTPTYAYDLARAIKQIMPEIKKYEKEIYHFSNEGVASWYDFAREIIDLNNMDCRVMPIETKDYPLPAQRPCYSVLNKSKIKDQFSIEIRHWKEALSECIKRIS